jgi:hypothetical protein
MGILFLVALVLAWPTSGLTIVAFIIFAIGRSFVQAKRRMQYANEKRAERAFIKGEDSLPSWIEKADEEEVFFGAIRAMVIRKGVPADFVDHVLQDSESTSAFLHFAGAMEAEGASFIEQQLAVSTKFRQYWDANKDVYGSAEDHRKSPSKSVTVVAEGSKFEAPRAPSAPPAPTINPVFNAAQNQVAKTLEKLKVSPQLILHEGKVLMTSEALRKQPVGWMGGDAIEVMIEMQGKAPYFVYYQNSDYYFALASGMANISAAAQHEKYRVEASQALTAFLVLEMYRQGIDISQDVRSFSHNRIHTNVLAFVKQHRNWYPIQHSARESDSATEEKVNSVNCGETEITEHIALRMPSPA